MRREDENQVFSILIADDMPMQVHMLEDFVRNQQPNALIYTAENGEDVLKIISKEKIDLVLSDIRMPQMDGLEMLRQVRRISKNTLVVFITAYALFEYAQEALQNGAIDFIVKPVDYKELEEKLILWEERFFLEQEKRSSLIQQQEKIILHKWFSLGYEKLEEEGKSILSQWIRSGWIANIFVPKRQNPDHVSNLFLKEIKIVLGERVFMIPSSNEKNNFFLIIQGKEEKEDLLLYKLKELAHHVQVRVGISSFKSMLLIDVETGKKNSQYGLNQAFYQNELVVLSDKNDIIPSPPMGTPAEWLSGVLGSEKEREKKFKKLLKNFQAQQPKVEQLKENTIYYIAITDEQIDPKKQDVSYISQCSQKLRNTLLWKEYIVILEESINYLVNKGKKNQDKQDDPIKDSVFYIQNHYDKPLSLRDMSERYYLSPKWFSFLFKKKIGLGFVEYLTELRLSKAAEKLHNSEKLIYEIAEECGYPDPRYFIRSFQKKYGMSPTQYRRLKKGGKE